ncbi:hypothetical protein EWF20_05485 [Sulfolobus sp. S-194]|uniref:hypothetical protein n=1 Tax=Sulfolobus sp. S-194 TaxID=2512240 RepID=UPI0014373990|nr:hypothetical protein [Sulfolobus sp. S-194]QIW23664.1 hypothetical protein EWF20_05485 [Sulfolobus sp. S-194]
MEITILRYPEELLLALAKEELFSNNKLKIIDNKFILRFLGFSIEGTFSKRIETNFAVYLFNSKLGGAKVNIAIVNVDEYSSRIRLEIRNWGIIGRTLKSTIQDLFLDFIINIEFKKSISLKKKLSVKLWTNYKGMEELLSKLTFDSSSYYFLIINKQYVVEIVNGIELVGEDVKKLCKDLCYVELYELKPNGI